MIEGFTIAAFNIEAMQAFYEHVFDIEFEEFKLASKTLYTGHWGELIVVLCPADLAGIEAQQNRHQLDILVEDLEKTLELALANGGTVISDKTDNETQKEIGIKDPDGNSIIIKEYNF